jgi:hypothetical protein
VKHEQLYQLCLRLYPRDFQEKYSREILLTFRNALLDTRSRGTRFSIFRFVVLAIFDVLKSVVEQRLLAGRKVKMSVNRWNWIARGLCVLTGMVLLCGSLLMWSVIETRGWAWANELEGILRTEPSMVLFLGCMVLLNLTSVLALTGFLLRLGMHSAWLPSIMAWLGFMVSIWGLATFPGDVVEPPSAPWMIFWTGLLLGFLAWALLGLVIRQQVKVCQRFLIPLLVGLLGMSGFSAFPLVKLNDLGSTGSALDCIVQHANLPVFEDDTRLFSQPVGTLFRCIAEAESQNYQQTAQIINLKRAQFFGLQCLILTSFAMIWLGITLKFQEEEVLSLSNPSSQMPIKS